MNGNQTNVIAFPIPKTGSAHVASENGSVLVATINGVSAAANAASQVALMIGPSPEVDTMLSALMSAQSHLLALAVEYQRLVDGLPLQR